VLQNVGMTRIDPVMYKGVEIVPLQFLASLLPEPSSLAQNYTGKTSIGCILQGVKDGKPVKKIIYNVCDHADCYREIGSQAVSYTAGVPAATAAIVMMKGLWKGQGVFNVEQLPPIPFLDEVARQGLPWHVEDVKIEKQREILAA
jgi:saccharopine dehydrogenase (NAD+, L-lysine-forming)